MTYRDDNLFIKLLGKALTTAVFIAIAATALSWASGYRYDWRERNLQKTALIAFEVNLRDVSIYLNGKLIANRAPYVARWLVPGRYQIKISKNNYHDWIQNFELDEGEVGVVDSVELIAEKPMVEISDKTDFQWIDRDFDYGLEVIDGELWDRDEFITRFNQSPSSAYRYRQAIIYVMNNQIRIFFPKSNIDYLIYNYPQNAKIALSLLSKWRIAIQEKSDNYQVVKLIYMNKPALSDREALTE